MLRILAVDALDVAAAGGAAYVALRLTAMQGEARAALRRDRPEVAAPPVA
ncbi:hypothetical protein [Streptomyces sp. WMMC1477]|nr:hypothetical protein [Streptomyces sp. WMMC1477]MCZ7430351.1 hypothetical protein [Streptomyces sp. WMMC1477]